MNGPEKSTVQVPTEREIKLSVALGVLWVVLLWDFFTVGVGALGFNATLFLFGVGALIHRSAQGRIIFCRENLAWTLPFIAMAVSYSLYENPFLKLTHILAIPVAWLIFYRRAALDTQQALPWSALSVLTSLIPGCIMPVTPVQSLRDIGRWAGKLVGTRRPNTPLLVRVGKGVAILVLLSAIVVVPLLSSADQDFGRLLSTATARFWSIIGNFFDLPVVYRGLVAILIAACLLGFVRVLAFSEEMPEDTRSPAKVDPIVSGIVLGGTLVFYLLFLGIQFERMFLSELPMQFSATETLVKSGFWQLVFLSVVNLILFTWVYGRAPGGIVRLLTAFTGACLFLVLSAGHRMFLYVTTYGFSYEKFYASYSVLFCIVLFVYLLRGIFSKARADGIRFACYLFLWMYGAVSLFPVEQFVLRSNIELAQREGSRIKMDEMTMLSADVLALVEDSRTPPASNKVPLTQEERSFTCHTAPPGLFDTHRWDEWLKKTRQSLRSKDFYEQNASSIIQAVLVKDKL